MENNVDGGNGTRLNTVESLPRPNTAGHDKAKEIRAAMRTTREALSKLAEGVDAFGTRIGDGETGPLTNPIKDSFGQHTEIRTFSVGCSPLETLGDGWKAITFHTTRGPEQRFVEIGRTPQKYDPKNGGESLHDRAGKPDDYLLAVRKTTPEPTTGKDVHTYTLRYLSEEDIAGMIIKKGEPKTSLGDNPKRKVPIEIPGQVTDVQALR